MSDPNKLNTPFERLEGALLGLVIETAPDGVIIIDETGIVRSFSPAAQRQFGYKAEEIIGRNIALLMPSPHAEKHDEHIHRYIQTGRKNIIGIGREVIAQKKNGLQFPVELAVGEVIIDGHRLFTGFVRDLTEHRKSEKQIALLQDRLVHVARHSALGELATTLAHELNQPLTAIANYTLVAKQLLAQREGGPQTDLALDMLDKAAAQAQRAGDIIRSIRTFIKHHKNTLHWEDPVDAVLEAVKIATIGTETQEIGVEIVKLGAIPKVRMDRIQIQQVVTNLVRNAVDAVAGRPGCKNVTIELEPHGRRSVIVRVIDNGPGITPEVQRRLFEPFNTSKLGGVGIGLAISKTIIASHRGEIRGKNNDGGGATFQFVLPIDAEAEEVG